MDIKINVKVVILKNIKNIVKQIKVKYLNIKTYYENNKDIIAKRDKYYRDQHKDTIAKRDKEYRDRKKDIISERSKEYYENNITKISNQHKGYYSHQYKETVAQRSKEYYEVNKTRLIEQNKEYIKNKRNTNLIFRLISINRTRTLDVLKSNYKAAHSDLLGCNKKFFYNWI